MRKCGFTDYYGNSVNPKLLEDPVYTLCVCDSWWPRCDIQLNVTRHLSGQQIVASLNNNNDNEFKVGWKWQRPWTVIRSYLSVCVSLCYVTKDREQRECQRDESQRPIVLCQLVCPGWFTELWVRDCTTNNLWIAIIFVEKYLKVAQYITSFWKSEVQNYTNYARCKNRNLFKCAVISTYFEFEQFDEMISTSVYTIFSNHWSVLYDKLKNATQGKNRFCNVNVAAAAESWVQDQRAAPAGQSSVGENGGLSLSFLAKARRFCPHSTDRRAQPAGLVLSFPPQLPHWHYKNGFSLA